MVITDFLKKVGIESEFMISLIGVVATLAITGFLAWVIYIIVKKWLPWLVGRLARRSKFRWDDVLFDQKFFNRLGMFLLPIVLMIGLSSVEWDGMKIINNLLASWIVVAGVLLISAFLDGLNRVYQLYEFSRNRPIKIFLQVVMIIIWIIAILRIYNILTGDPISKVVTGLAALTAVLMLVFQDTILGFVAGIQMNANNMVRIGDWIVMPSRGVDGNVVDIGLTTVKVQNFDKTITTVPTHKLVSESFTNWRGMEDSGGRRIKRSVNIDVTSIRYLTDQDMVKLKESNLLKEYIERKEKELDEYNANRESHLDERRLTNIGTFREYLEEWIAVNPNVHQGMTHMVRQLQPGPTGLPLEVYVFSAKQSWIDYENVQSDIFDHIFAVMPIFGLRAFQYSGGVAGIQS